MTITQKIQAAIKQIKGSIALPMKREETQPLSIVDLLQIPSPQSQGVTRQEAENAIRTLIRAIGDDPDREGLRDTPRRVIDAWVHDWGEGYNSVAALHQVDSILNGQFTDGKQIYSQLITVKKIHFMSHCEHHLAEFTGTVDIGYIPSPDGRILGLSKLVRVVNIFSRRLQVQERLTDQIANFIDQGCRPLGVGVVIRAKHSCMISRGVRQSETEATTSALRGELLTEPEVRDEFYRVIGL